MSLAAIGLALGLGGAWWAAQLLSNVLFGVKPSDPVTFGAVSLVLLFVALLASSIPAWRATRLDPLFALRCE